MRCPSCGTENAPDSRFCGGCGSRTPGPALVAPTQKMTGDTPYRPTAQPHLQPQQPHLQPQPQQPHPSTPSPDRRDMQLAETGGAPISPSPRHARAPSPGPDPSLVERPASGRRWGLVAVVLLIDVALAGSGAYMLNHALAEAPATAARVPQSPLPPHGTP